MFPGIKILRRFSLAALFLAACLPAWGAGDLPSHHSADTNRDGAIGLSELLRVIQFFNSDGYSCDAPTEDGFRPGPGDRASCARHDSDYQDPEWRISLSELLRLIQMFNARVYGFDPSTEDGFRPIFDPEDPTGTIQGESEDLRRFVEEAPDESLDLETKEELIQRLLEAEVAFVQDDLCEAADRLDETMDLAQEVRARKQLQGNGTELIVFARARELQYRILTSGGPESDCPGRGRENKSPETELGESDAEKVTLQPRFGAARYKATRPLLAEGSEEVFLELVVPGFDVQGGEAGLPGIPCIREFVAVPPGAFVQLHQDRVDIAETRFVRLLPYRVDPLDQPSSGGIPPLDRDAFLDQPFFINEQIYATNAFFPPEPSRATPLGTMRGLEVYLIEACAGQYNPVTEELRLFEAMDLRFTFSNGPTGFQPEFMTQPFESNPDLYLGPLLNVDAARDLPPIPDIIQPGLVGEELLILTHPDFREASDRLAAWKNQKGIMTTVFECGTNTGIQGRQTAAEIQTFIENRFKSTLLPMSYILLMGDAEFIPTHYVPRSELFPRYTPNTIGSDHPYAVIPVTVGPFTFDLLPTFALGRIPVDTLAQADAVVDKIIAYESNPPTGPANQAFYRRIMLAAQFQCCRTDIEQEGTAQRTFTEVSEFVRPALAARGYDARRLYRRTISSRYTADPTPRRYYDGTPLPAAIGPAGGFGWDAGTADVRGLFNEGVVLAFHRDHGWPGGWDTPRFSTENLPLQNGALQPVIFSINCSSGVFDNETSGGAEGVTSNGVYWVERILRQADGGAVGVIASSRVSPSWANSALARGLFNAIFPEVLPSYGGNTRHRRLGDILNHAKLYLLSQTGTTFVGGDSVRDMFFLYHVIGDPTLEIWTDAPSPFLNFNVQVLGASQSTIELSFDAQGLAGSEITLYQQAAQIEGVMPIGRGTVNADGSVNIPPFQFWDSEQDVFFSLNQEGFIPGDGSVRLPF